MKRETRFTVSIDDINKLDNLVEVAQWSKNKICETLNVISEYNCCKEELQIVAARLEQAAVAGSKALDTHE